MFSFADPVGFARKVSLAKFSTIAQHQEETACFRNADSDMTHPFW